MVVLSTHVESCTTCNLGHSFQVAHRVLEATEVAPLIVLQTMLLKELSDSG